MSGHNTFKRIVLLMLLACVLQMPLSQDSPALEPRQHCESCRRFLDESPGFSRVRIEGEKRNKSIEACSLFCLYELLESNKLEGEQFISVLDYASFSAEDQSLMLLRQAHCLYEPTVDEDLTHEPVVFYFRSEEEARAAQKIHGGKLRGYDEVSDECRALAEEYEPDGGSSYQPLSIRPRNSTEKSKD